MARRSILVSDLSGAEIDARTGAKIRILFEDARRGVFELDVTAEEAEALALKGRKIARHARRPRGDG